MTHVEGEVPQAVSLPSPETVDDSVVFKTPAKPARKAHTPKKSLPVKVKVASPSASRQEARAPQDDDEVEALDIEGMRYKGGAWVKTQTISQQEGSGLVKVNFYLINKNPLNWSYTLVLLLVHSHIQIF